MRKDYIKKYSDNSPHDIIVLCFEDEKYFEETFCYSIKDVYIYDLRDIDGWYKHSSFTEKKYWIDVTLFLEAYELYLADADSGDPVYNDLYFIEKIIDDDISDIKKFLLPLLRLKKLERILI